MATTLPLVQTFPSDPSALGDIRRFIVERAQEAPLPSPAVDDLVIAVSEACGEILAHEQGQAIFVCWWQHDGRIEIRLRDEGVERYLAPAPDPAEQRPESEHVEAATSMFPYLLAFVDEYLVVLGDADEPGARVRLVKEVGAA